MNKDLTNYLMLPQEIEGVGNIYPVRLKDIEDFNKFSGLIFANGKTSLKNLYKYEGEYLLDFLINPKSPLVIYKNLQDQTEEIIKNNPNKEQVKIMKDVLKKTKEELNLEITIEDFENIFKIITREEVKFEYVNVDNNFEYTFKIGNNKGNINKYNFNSVRDLVMEQNIIFEPVTSPSKLGNDIIRKTMEKLYIGGRKTSMASMIGIVNQELKLEGNILDYTYYRLVYDFKLIERKHNNIYNAIFASQGAKNCIIEGLNEEIDMYDNPFSKDKLFPRKVGKNEFDKNLGKK